MKRYFIALAVGMGLVTAASAQTDKNYKVVTTSVPFLRISPDARGGAMGETGLATSPDAASAFWNIAKIPFSADSSAIAASYSPWLKKLGLNDVYLATLTGFYKLDDNQALTASVRYFSLGNIQLTDNNGMDLGTTRPREFSVEGGYSRKLSRRLGLGMALRYINSNLISGRNINGVDYKTGTAVSGDLGLFYDSRTMDGRGWSFGALLSNLGTKIGYSSDAKQKDYIPANLGIGASYTKVFDENSSLAFSVDVNKLLVPTPPTDSAALVAYHEKSVVNSWMSSLGDAEGGFGEELKEVMIGGGAEYNYNEQFFVRAGYFYENKMKGNRKYFTTGIGLTYQKFGFNFCYVVPAGSGPDQNPLSSTLRFSLTLKNL